MDLVDDIIQGEILFPRRFARVEERAWGLLHWTPDIPSSHDGNHARILTTRDPSGAVAEVEDFYRQRGLTPRVYHLSRPGAGRDVRKALDASGFEFGDYGNQYYVHRRASRITPGGELTIRRVKSALPDLLAMVEQNEGPRAMRVVQRSLAYPDYHLLVGFLGDRPVSMAAVELSGPICRVDDVLTDGPFRRKASCLTKSPACLVIHGMEAVQIHPVSIDARPVLLNMEREQFLSGCIGKGQQPMESAENP